MQKRSLPIYWNFLTRRGLVWIHSLLFKSLKVFVQSKRFLLVLDDIWEKDIRKWENVLFPLVYGCLVSKILVTTRMDYVAAMISNVIRKNKETLKLNGLEENECSMLLNTHALACVENLDAHTKLTDIASLIVKKLSGSPLAAKIIGGVLNSNLNESFWMNILNSTNVLNVELESSRNDIFPILRLSFTFLPQPLPNCFTFCGIFPQDYQFDKADLIQMWITLGFTQESSIEQETLEDIGGRYFNVLFRKSFFDKFQDEKIYYKMYDLLHELAQSISLLESFRFVGDNVSSFRILKRLSIVAYKGVSCAKWMYNADLISTLEYINLNGCSEWETFPPFGELPNLKSLYLCNMTKVKQLDNKFSRNNNICVIPALEDLFDKAGAAADDCFFPCLTELFLLNCPNLQELRYLPLKLKKIQIHRVGWKASLNWKQGSNNCCGISKSIPLESLDVPSCPNIASLLQADVRLEALRKLRIEGCPNLISLGGLQQVESGIEKFQPILSEVVIDEPSLLPMVSIGSLEMLKICNNDVLQSLPSSLERLSSLRILHVVNVPLLQQLLLIPASLEELYLEYLESLHCLPVSLSTISFLNRIWLKSIPLLKSLPSSLSAISSLKHLVLDSIPLLKSLSDLPSSLHYLTIFKLDNLQWLSSLSTLDQRKIC